MKFIAHCLIIAGLTAVLYLLSRGGADLGFALAAVYTGTFGLVGILLLLIAGRYSRHHR